MPKTSYFFPLKKSKDNKSLVECYGPDQAEIHIKCDAYQRKFEAIFPPPGCSGWLALGVEYDRMAKIAEEIEIREAKRMRS